MHLPQEIDDYIKGSIEHSLGLPVSERTLTLKLHAYQDVQQRLRDQYLLVLHKLKEKDGFIERARAEAAMNAQALKKFVDENQKLAVECSYLLSKCSKLEKECALYDLDREALMDFGNEADERCKAAELRAYELEEEVRKLSEEVQFHKRESNIHVGDSSEEGTAMEEQLIESVVTSLMGRDKVAQNALSFLEENCEVDTCQRLLKMSNSLKPSTLIVLSLAAEARSLRRDKEHLRINLHRAEEEVKVLFEENTILYEENKRLFGQCHKERNHQGSSAKHKSKRNKRKSNVETSSPNVRKIEFNEFDSPRQALSPLQHNSPDCIIHK